MKITYPNMGNLGIAVKTILEGLGFELTTPPAVSKKSAILGTKYAPEGACYPFKLVLGNTIEALQQGADTVVMLGGGGPCRFGYFGHLMGEILKDSGYNCKTIILEGDQVLEQINSLRITAGVGWLEVVRAIRLGWFKIAVADRLEKLVAARRAVESWPGVMDRILNYGMGLIDNATNEKSLRQMESVLIHNLGQFMRVNAQPTLKIGIVGDIYMLIEPYANHRLEEYLGGLGVEIHRSIYVSNWVKGHLGKLFTYIHQRGLLADADPYLTDFVGGHGLDTVANTIRYYRRGFDGIIHVLPMTCMPEIVAQSITPHINKDLGIPVLTLVLDEQSGTAGLHSRLEAFTDIILRKKKQVVQT